MLVFATSSGQAWLIFVLRKKEREMKKRKEDGLRNAIVDLRAANPKGLFRDCQT